MPKYLYSILNQSFGIEKGKITASSQTEAAINLKPYYILSIKKPSSFPRIFKKETKFWVLFFSCFSSLINNGFPISKALELMSQEENNEWHRSILNKINNYISNGHLLSYALLNCNFSMPQGNYIISLIKQGESGGYLGETLKDINNYLDDRKIFIDNIKNSFVHPVILLSVFFVFFVLTNLFIIPNFESLFNQLNYPINPLLKSVVVFNNILILSVLCGIVLVFMLFRAKKGHILTFYLKYLPFINKIYQKIFIIYFFKNLSFLLKKGFSIHDSLSIIQSSLTNKTSSSTIDKIQNSIKNGNTFYDSIKSLKGLTSLHSQLIYISEKSTNLPEAIFNISKILEKEIKQLLNNLTKLIEPLIIIFLGLWLGITILLIFSPIFQLIQNLSYN